jgi:hypothetical protein
MQFSQGTLLSLHVILGKRLRYIGKKLQVIMLNPSNKPADKPSTAQKTDHDTNI